MSKRTRKIVGITCSGGKFGQWQLPTDYARTAYVRSCEQAGLLPILLPVTDDEEVRAAQLDLVDGLLLTGGEDIHPRFYGEGENIHPATTAVEERRDVHEIALIQKALARDLPIFGICRGLQILNVALGGTLHQDIAEHRQTVPTVETGHCVTIVAESRLATILHTADSLAVNSHHHQAAKAVASGLAVAARADDGTIEALEKPDARYVLAVQWHPENLTETNAAARRLFAAFADAL